MPRFNKKYVRFFYKIFIADTLNLYDIFKQYSYVNFKKLFANYRIKEYQDVYMLLANFVV